MNAMVPIKAPKQSCSAAARELSIGRRVIGSVGAAPKPGAAAFAAALGAGHCDGDGVLLNRQPVHRERIGHIVDDRVVEVGAAP